MVRVIGVVQSKGGAGKTTTAMSLLGGLQELGKSAALFDVDSDEPDSHTWSQNGEYFDSVFKVDHKDLKQEVEAKKESNQFEYIILDTPGDLKSATMKALSLSKLCIIPLQPSGMDLAGAIEVEDLCQTLNIDYRFILVCSSNTINTRDVMRILDERPSIKTDIPRSVHFVNAFNEGSYIGDVAKNTKSHIAIKKVVKELIEITK
ncbi:AAA family ATPase [Francisellaceae bacterium]|nr:AAA family ATPase [Francisellaceae bacterium]